jgi:hypothetical protein
MLVAPRLSGHDKAPLFTSPDAQRIFAQVVSEVQGGNFPATQAFLSIFRQAGLVSLWFFERCVLSYNGPYSELDTGIHMEVCNFRQGTLEPGARDAVALPRSGLKSTTCTHGATTWELVRNPDLCAGIVSFPSDRAVEFYKLVKTNFEKNALLHELYPECIPDVSNGSRWTEKELVMPGRTIPKQDPSLKPITAGGATQGIHLDLAVFDDLVGDSMLDSDRHATADMTSMSNWFSDNKATMLRHPEKSRVCFVFTRYGLVDPGEIVMLNSKEHFGNWFNVEDYYPIQPSGEWRTYYRSARDENGESILPDRFSTAFLDRFQKENPIGYQLNYANDPHIPEAADLSGYTVKDAGFAYNPVSDAWEITFPDSGTAVTLASCDVVQTLDPAGGSQDHGSQASKTAHVVLATTSDGRQVVLWARADFVKTSVWWDWLFKTKAKWPCIRRTAAELQAGFKSLDSLMREEIARRHTPIGWDPVNALGDKDTTIRAYIEPVLSKGQLYVVPMAKPVIVPELKAFPGGRKDSLDALKIAIYIARKPLSSEEREAYDNSVLLAETALGRNKTTGY